MGSVEQSSASGSTSPGASEPPPVSVVAPVSSLVESVVVVSPALPVSALEPVSPAAPVSVFDPVSPPVAVSATVPESQSQFPEEPSSPLEHAPMPIASSIEASGFITPASLNGIRTGRQQPDHARRWTERRRWFLLTR